MHWMTIPDGVKTCSEVRLALILYWLFVVVLSYQERAGFLPSASLHGAFCLKMRFGRLAAFLCCRSSSKLSLHRSQRAGSHKMTPVPRAGGTKWQLQEAGVALGSISLLLFHAEPQQQQQLSPGKSLSVPEPCPQRVPNPWRTPQALVAP